MTQDEQTIDLLCEAADKLEVLIERIERDIIKTHPYISWEYETAKESLNKINNFLTKIGAVE
jgi:hypothetical protein